MVNIIFLFKILLCNYNIIMFALNSFEQIMFSIGAMIFAGIFTYIGFYIQDFYGAIIGAFIGGYIGVYIVCEYLNSIKNYYYKRILYEKSSICD